MTTDLATPVKNPADFVPGPKGNTGKPGTDRAVAELEAKLIDLFERGDFAEALRFVSRLHNYSLWNRLLIEVGYMQRNLTGRRMVAGLRAWDTKHGRKVRKGSKAIWIFAPLKAVAGEKRDGTGNVVIGPNGKSEKIFRIVGYKVVPVFAVQDTDGPDLPDFDSIERTTNVADDTDEARALLARLVAHSADTYGVPVAFETSDTDEHLATSEAHGYYHKIEKRIVLRDGAPAGHLAMVMAHELGHHVAHENEKKLGWEVGKYADHEVVVQAAAWCVCDRVGIDTDDFTLPYVAGWGKDIGRIRRCLWFVAKVADSVTPPEVTVDA